MRTGRLRARVALVGLEPIAEPDLCLAYLNLAGKPLSAVDRPAFATAATFVWLGMVLAICFLEAPLKFRARGVTLPIGLGISLLVFRVLKRHRGALADVLLVAVASERASAWNAIVGAVPAAPLATPLAARPTAARSTVEPHARARAGFPRSRAHLACLVRRR